MTGRVTLGAAGGHEQGGGAHLDGFVGHGRRTFEVDQRHVAGGEKAVAHRAELDHAPVVGPGRSVGKVEVGLMFPLVQPGVVERVEHQLRLHADEVEHPRPILGQERAGGGKVLAVHDLDRLVGGVGRRLVLGQDVVERLVEIVDTDEVTELFQLVGVLRTVEALTDDRIGVVPKPVRRLHDVRVGVVNDSVFDVGHGCILAHPTGDV